MSAPKVSVIVPVYNVEKYIARCINSIKNQTFKDFEVLIINDGTPDNSIEAAKNVIGDDKRFVIYDKENGGLSDARNYGLARAKGEYVVFIDSDDFVDSDYIRILYNECILENADISCCRYTMYFCDHFNPPVPVGKKACVLDSKEALDMLIRDNNMQSFAWNKMYKRSLFSETGINYPVMYFEDVATTPRVMFNAGKVAISEKYLYSYVRRFGSILSTMNVKKINDYIRSYFIIRNYLEQKGAYNQFKDALKAVSCKVSLINVYSILREHIIARNFDEAGENLALNFSLFKQVNSGSFTVTDGLPDLPRKLKQPQKKDCSPQTMEQNTSKAADCT